MVDNFSRGFLLTWLFTCCLWIPHITGETYVCDFETDQCGFTKEAEPAQWIRNYGPSWLRSTVGLSGPATDHTEGATTGFYMVLLNLPNKVYSPGDKARLISSCYPASRSVDVTFYYHMYGDGIGQLNVFLVDCTLVSPPGLSVISITGDQGDEWKLAGFSQANVGEFKIVFEAIRGETNNSDIAIDDITVKRTEPESNTDPQEYLDEANIVCTFESDSCGYQQDQTDDTDMIYHFGTSWLRQLDGSTGPTGDHTNGIQNNFYMILMNIPGTLDLQPGDTARLVSPCYSISNWVRILFFYHMYGEGMGTLNVYSSDCELLSEKQIFFSVSGNQGDEWKEGNNVIKAGDSVQIIFETVRGSEQTSDIAIDDIALFALDDEDITTTTEEVITTKTEAPTTPEPIQTTVPAATTVEQITTQANVVTTLEEIQQSTSPTVRITENVVDPCNPNPCQNEGECTTDNAAYQCLCLPQWTGDNCDVQKAERAADDNSGFTTINVVAIVIACIAVIILLGCFVIFGYKRGRTDESKPKYQTPSYAHARALQEQLYQKQIHLPRTNQTYRQKQQLIEEENERKLEEQRRRKEEERLKQQQHQKQQQQQEQNREEEERQRAIQQQISLDSIETNDATTIIRPPLRKQQSTGRKLPKLPNSQNFV
ncbi:MAM and LDL-receptor class A domain-containing protein 1-like [Anneissia japonica]|uniref:MAM and LDL-receptor class A domain-containing protein 1-like n=1 Tax=Anneissia japonica TaxID=1529436 RepID=UPI0014257981|nr:MAM and LDL-receptor class A domain-containing protein 1-like [Anneissia japonica]